MRISRKQEFQENEYFKKTRISKKMRISRKQKFKENVNIKKMRYET